jgi:hypothetical protein
LQAFASASAAGFGFGPTMTSRVDVTSGNAAISLNGGSYFGSTWAGVLMQASFNYGTDNFGAGQSVDLSAMTSANILGSGNLSVTAGAIPQVDIMMMLNSGSATRTWTMSFGAGAIGNVAFSLNSGFTAGGSGAFSYANVTSVRFAFSFSGTGSYGSTQSGAGAFGYSVSQFNFVPAPGAIAILGVAGVVGARRRRGPSLRASPPASAGDHTPRRVAFGRPGEVFHSGPRFPPTFSPDSEDPPSDRGNTRVEASRTPPFHDPPPRTRHRPAAHPRRRRHPRTRHPANRRGIRRDIP